MNMKTTTLLAAFCLLASCKKETATTSTVTPVAPSAELSKVLATAPTGEAKDIHTARTTAKPGEEITLTGRIMGNLSPFVPGRAVFIMGDPTILKACNEMPGDKCETPWDNCCATAEEKKAATATIQIVGSDGRVLKEGIEGAGGLNKLAEVTITGKVAEGSNSDLLLVNATAVHAK